MTRPRLTQVTHLASISSSYVNASVHRWTLVLRKYFNIKIIAGSKRKHVLVQGNVLVKSFQAWRNLRDSFSLSMIIEMLRDRCHFVIIHGLFHLSTLFALLIYGVRKKSMILINRGIYGYDRLILRIRNQLILNLIRLHSVPVISLNEHDGRYLVNAGINENKSVVFPIWLSEFDLSNLNTTKSKLTPRPRNLNYKILYVGRLEERPVEVLIETISQLRKFVPNCTLTVVGRGFRKRELESYTKKLEVNKKIKFVGFVPRDFIWKFYVESDVLVLPTYSEGFPVVILEAWASGLPVVVSRIPQLKDILVEGENGLFFSNREELLSILLKLHNDQELRSRLIDGGLKTSKRCQSQTESAVDYIRTRAKGEEA